MLEPAGNDYRPLRTVTVTLTKAGRRSVPLHTGLRCAPPVPGGQGVVDRRSRWWLTPARLACWTAAVVVLQSCGRMNTGKAGRRARADVAKARKILREARSTLESGSGGANPGTSLGRRMLLNDITQAQVRAGDKGALRGAIRAAQAQERESQRKYALLAIAEAQARAGDARGALKTAKGLDLLPHQRAGLLKVVAKAQAEAGDVKGALQHADEARDLWTQQTSQLKASGDAGRLDSQMKGLGFTSSGLIEFQRAEILADISVAAGERGDVAGAKQATSAFPGTITSATSSQGGAIANCKTKALAGLALAQIKAGDAKGLASTRDEMVRLARLSGSPGWLPRVAVAQAEAGDIPGAVETVNMIQQPALRTPPLRAVVKAQVRAGQAGVALETAQRQGDEAARAALVSAIASAQAESGDIAGALQTAGTLTAPHSKGAAFACIAEQQADSGDLPGAKQTIKKALAVAATMASTDLQSRDALLSLIADAQARIGDLEGIETTVQSMGNGRWKREAQGALAAARAKAGETTAAQEALESALAGAELWRVSSIIRSQVDSGNVSGALSWARARPDSEERARVLLYIGQALLR